MRYDAIMDESVCYRAIMALYNYFLASIFVRIIIGSARTIYGIFGKIVYNSESRRLFISTCSAFRGNMLHFTSASKLSARKGAIKYAASVYHDSYTFRLINKTI